MKNVFDKIFFSAGSLIWTRDMTLLFISLYKKNEQIFSSGKPQKKCWKHISEEMATQKYVVSANQCASKFASLKQTYKRVKDHNSRSGNSKRNWSFFDVSLEILVPIVVLVLTVVNEYTSVYKPTLNLSHICCIKSKS